MRAVSALHHSDVIMGVIASKITSLSIVYSTVYSDVDQRKHQSSASLAFVRGIHRWPVISPHKWPVTRKMFPFDDVIMVIFCCGFVPVDFIDIHQSTVALRNRFILCFSGLLVIRVCIHELNWQPHIWDNSQTSEISLGYLKASIHKMLIRYILSNVGWRLNHPLSLLNNIWSCVYSAYAFLLWVLWEDVCFVLL